MFKTTLYPAVQVIFLASLFLVASCSKEQIPQKKMSEEIVSNRTDNTPMCDCEYRIIDVESAAGYEDFSWDLKFLPDGSNCNGCPFAKAHIEYDCECDYNAPFIPLGCETPYDNCKIFTDFAPSGWHPFNCNLQPHSYHFAHLNLSCCEDDNECLDNLPGPPFTETMIPGSMTVQIRCTSINNKKFGNPHDCDYSYVSAPMIINSPTAPVFPLGQLAFNLEGECGCEPVQF